MLRVNLFGNIKQFSHECILQVS